jgi:hypothetical protein
MQALFYWARYALLSLDCCLGEGWSVGHRLWLLNTCGDHAGADECELKCQIRCGRRERLQDPLSRRFSVQQVGHFPRQSRPQGQCHG